MIFGIPIADIIIGIIAVLLVELCIYSIFRKKKKCCTKCGGCPYSDKCGDSCERGEKNK